MEQREITGGTVARRGVTWPCVPGHSVWRARARAIGLGLLGVLIAEGGYAPRRSVLLAQTPLESLHLTVQPQAVATGTRTARAGEQPLDSLKDAVVYVPASCVGTRRSPLVVLLSWGGEPTALKDSIRVRDRQMADSFGVILLTLTSTKGDTIDAAIEQVLRSYAIAPDQVVLTRISMNGEPATGANLFLGRPNEKTRYRFLAGIATNQFQVRGFFDYASFRRNEGHVVEEQALTLGSRDRSLEDYNGMWRWLAAGLATSPRPGPRALTDSLPVLTAEAITNLTTFWTRFMAEPVAIGMRAREAHQQEVLLPVGPARVSLRMTDMPALAAKYPSVAAALKAANLTAQQHDAYRLALVSASAAWQAQGMAGPVDTLTILGKNIAFMSVHKQAFRVLGATRIWTAP